MALITYLTRIQRFGRSSFESELTFACAAIDRHRPGGRRRPGAKSGAVHEHADALYDGTTRTDGSRRRDALKIYKDEGCDGIIAIGGGSPMDLAKAVGLMATHAGPSLQPYSFVEGGAGKITAAVAPIVAIPTTSGTGSEVSRGGVIIMDSGRKLAIGSPYLIPKLALIDPEMTLGLPPHLTAGTGMDAFTHKRTSCE